MQQPVSGSDVYEFSASAVVNGAQVEVSGLQVDRSLPDPLSGGSLGAASVSFTAVDGPDVTGVVVTPWDPGSQWPPAPESPVSASMDAGSGPVSLLADGRVVSAGGGTSGREIEVEASDAYRTLDRPISWDGLADAMPALTEATTQRYVSLHASYVTDRILRHCGWFATPPRAGFTALSVPAMGSMWPESGRVESCVRYGASGYPAMFTEPWGKGVSMVDAWFYRQAAYSVKGRGRAEFTAIAGRTNGGTMHMLARTDSWERYRLSWTDSTASLWVTDAGGSFVSIASLPRSVGSFIYATVEYVSDTSVRVVFRVDGASTTSVVTVVSPLATQPLTYFQIVGDGVGGGFQVSFPSASGTLAGWKRNAVIYDRSASANHLLVMPPVEGENCVDLLAQQCAAQNATYWIDETGVLRWWDMARLEARSSVATLTADDDIAEAGFSWSHDLSSVKRQVSVDWREPLVEGGWRTNVDLWQGNGKTVETTGGNNPIEDWISAPDGEVWIMPDLSLNRVGPEDLNDFNYGWGSHYGAVTRTPEGLDRWAQLSGSFLMSIERVTDSSFKYAITWTGTDQAVMRAPSDESISDVWKVRRGLDLPILRGKKKYTFGDMTYRAAQTGPATAPDHVIGAGWWIQTAAQAQITADYAAARLTVPQPVLSSVALIPVPGLQLGDMVTVTDGAVSRLTVRGIVVDDARSVDAGMSVSHSVAIRPVSVTRNGVTWTEWATVARPKNWKQWATSEGGTWKQWGSNPLNA